MIQPCDCKGDVGAVHHDCLRRWLVESADNPDALNCKVRAQEIAFCVNPTFSNLQYWTLI